MHGLAPFFPDFSLFETNLGFFADLPPPFSQFWTNSKPGSLGHKLGGLQFGLLDWALLGSILGPFSIDFGPFFN